MPVYLTWISISVCVIFSGAFSGLTLSLFGLGRLRLESEADSGNQSAKKVLRLREDSNFLLATLLWGNVSVNTLLALLTESVMTGLHAFLFTTFIITFFGEIIPQAWFSRNALFIGSKLTPLVRGFQFVLYPLAKPSAIMLDIWLGKEGLHYFSEETLKVLLEKHIHSTDSEIEKFEGIGALNFLKMDDLPIYTEGEKIHPKSIFNLPIKLDLPDFPDLSSTQFEGFLQKLIECPVKWAIFVGPDNLPKLALNTDSYIKAYYSKTLVTSYQHCHRPYVFANSDANLSEIATKFKVESVEIEDDIIKNDIVLLWNDKHKKIITGTDLLGRLFRGIVKKSNQLDLKLK
jgi:hypothetical protein